MNSHLDVFVASYQNELTTCILFCKITLIQSSLAIWGCSKSVEAHRKLKVVFKRTKSSRNPLPVAQKQQTASGTELWCWRNILKKKTWEVCPFFPREFRWGDSSLLWRNPPFGCCPFPGGHWQVHVPQKIETRWLLGKCNSQLNYERLWQVTSVFWMLCCPLCTEVYCLYKTATKIRAFFVLKMVLTLYFIIGLSCLWKRHIK